VGAADSSGAGDGVCGAATGVVDFGCHFLRSVGGAGEGLDVSAGAGSGGAADCSIGVISETGVGVVGCSGGGVDVLGCHFLRSGVGVGGVI
jgi:hypothetical protein